MQQSGQEHWDILIRDALVFDGTGNKPEQMDIAISNGKIAAKGGELDASKAERVIDAAGKWCMPGLLDIHTHFDLEVELEPWLPETVRHGTTTVVMSNCSLGVAFGHQKKENQNPVLDCFARVENLPKNVLQSAIDKMDWHNTAEYYDHFDDMPLGPNVVPMVPYSMLRIEVMGLEESIKRKPTRAEMDRMLELLENACDEGYVGMSTDNLPLHYLSEDPHRGEIIPSQHATYKELKELLGVLRMRNRIWQTTPDPDKRLNTLRQFTLTSGKLHGKPLRTTATAAIDLSTNKGAWRGLVKFSQLLNKRLDGDFTFQALSAPFRVYAEATTTPLMEEKPAFRELIELEPEDVEGRRKLLNDPAYIRRFRKAWFTGRKGINMDRLLKKLNIEPTTFSRELRDMYIDSCPVKTWSQECIEDIYQRYLEYRDSNGERGYKDEEEKAAFEKCSDINDDADFILHLLREYDRDLRWWVTTANENPDILKYLLFHEETLPGFNDSGAHLINMAFYDGNLQTLKIAADDSIELVSKAVKRLTRDPAKLFAIDAGTLDVGAQADVILVDPEALKAYNSLEHTEIIYRDCFQHRQMVNRSDGVVTHTIINGKVAWESNDFTDLVGKQAFGRALRFSKPALLM